MTKSLKGKFWQHLRSKIEEKPIFYKNKKNCSNLNIYTHIIEFKDSIDKQKTGTLWEYAKNWHMRERKKRRREELASKSSPKNKTYQFELNSYLS